MHGLLHDRECGVVFSFRSLAAELPEFDLPRLERSIVWLAKMGALELLP